MFMYNRFRFGKCYKRPNEPPIFLETQALHFGQLSPKITTWERLPLGLFLGIVG